VSCMLVTCVVAFGDPRVLAVGGGFLRGTNLTCGAVRPRSGPEGLGLVVPISCSLLCHPPACAARVCAGTAARGTASLPRSSRRSSPRRQRWVWMPVVMLVRPHFRGLIRSAAGLSIVVLASDLYVIVERDALLFSCACSKSRSLRSTTASNTCTKIRSSAPRRGRRRKPSAGPTSTSLGLDVCMCSHGGECWVAVYASRQRLHRFMEAWVDGNETHCHVRGRAFEGCACAPSALFKLCNGSMVSRPRWLMETLGMLCGAWVARCSCASGACCKREQGSKEDKMGGLMHICPTTHGYTWQSQVVRTHCCSGALAFSRRLHEA
jgi:hypothetical protein